MNKSKTQPLPIRWLRCMVLLACAPIAPFVSAQSTTSAPSGKPPALNASSEPTRKRIWPFKMFGSKKDKPPVVDPFAKYGHDEQRKLAAELSGQPMQEPAPRFQPPRTDRSLPETSHNYPWPTPVDSTRRDVPAPPSATSPAFAPGTSNQPSITERLHATHTLPTNGGQSRQLPGRLVPSDLAGTISPTPETLTNPYTAARQAAQQAARRATSSVRNYPASRGYTQANNASPRVAQAGHFASPPPRTTLSPQSSGSTTTVPISTSARSASTGAPQSTSVQLSGVSPNTTWSSRMQGYVDPRQQRAAERRQTVARTPQSAAGKLATAPNNPFFDPSSHPEHNSQNIYTGRQTNSSRRGWENGPPTDSTNDASAAEERPLDLGHMAIYPPSQTPAQGSNIGAKTQVNYPKQPTTDFQVDSSVTQPAPSRETGNNVYAPHSPSANGVATSPQPNSIAQPQNAPTRNPVNHHAYDTRNIEQDIWGPSLSGNPPKPPTAQAQTSPQQTAAPQIGSVSPPQRRLPQNVPYLDGGPDVAQASPKTASQSSKFAPPSLHTPQIQTPNLELNPAQPAMNVPQVNIPPLKEPIASVKPRRPSAQELAEAFRRGTVSPKRPQTPAISSTPPIQPEANLNGPPVSNNQPPQVATQTPANQLNPAAGSVYGTPDVRATPSVSNNSTAEPPPQSASVYGDIPVVPNATPPSNYQPFQATPPAGVISAGNGSTTPQQRLSSQPPRSLTAPGHQPSPYQPSPYQPPIAQTEPKTTAPQRQSPPAFSPNLPQDSPVGQAAGTPTDFSTARTATQPVAPGNRELDLSTKPFQSPLNSTELERYGQLDKSSEVIAVIGDQTVLSGDLLWQINQMLAQHEGAAPDEEIAKARLMLMERMLPPVIDNKLVFMDFLRTLPPGAFPEIEQKIYQEFKKSKLPELLKESKSETAAELDAELRVIGSSLAKQRQLFLEKLVGQQMVQRNVQVSKEVTHDDLLKYYYDHAADYEHPARVKWERIMMNWSEFPDRDAARRAIADAGNRVWLQKQPFASVAKDVSQGPNASSGGSYDWTTKGALKSETIERAIFSLAIGGMSRPIEDEDGIHIIRVIERVSAGKTPFEDVQGDIANKIRQQRFGEQVQEYLTELREQTHVETIFDKVEAEQIASPQLPMLR